jgi:Ni/Fe-hydrogenase 1 B-type cytochrome subunit
MFAGNKYARWDQFLPLTPRKIKHHIAEMFSVLKVDILQIQKKPVDYVGHNALASASYLGLFAATIFQTVTGFGLYAAMSPSWFPHLFAWVVPFMGGDGVVRQWHHAVTWVFVVFAMIHVYLALFHDRIEARGEVSSIISGTRFVERR